MTRARQLLIPALLAGEARLEDLAPETAAELLEELGPLVGQLAVRAQTAVQIHPLHPPAASTAEQLLTPQVAAGRLGVSVRWIYRHASELPFTRRLSSRTLRFSEGGIARYVAQKRS